MSVAHAHPILDSANTGSGNDAAIALTILLAACGYIIGFRKVRNRRSHEGREAGWRLAAFAGGLAAVGGALLSPLDRWGAELFSLHMIQHEVLMLIAAPLLVLGRPLPLFLWAFAESWRPYVARFTRRSAVQGAWAALLSPPVAWVLHALSLWVWHVPRYFDAVLRSTALHELQHLTFLGAALAFWAAVMETRRPAQQGAAIVYLFTTTVHTSVLGALITFAARPWYAAYLQIPRSWGLTALEDQQLGGLIMWVPGSLVYVGIALALLVRWMRATEKTVLVR
jgi:putative membrane protein